MELLVFALIPVLAALAAVTWIVWQLLRGLRWLLIRVFRLIKAGTSRSFGFLSTEFVELVQLTGGLLTAAVLVPLTGINLAIGRWKTGRHYARALEDELVAAVLGVYRISLAHPLRAVGLGGILDGLERRIPDVVDRAPRYVRKPGPIDFDGYEVVGTLPAGGSGAQLYLARPRKATVERARAAGREMPADVVIKSFALVQGSTLPQIVRESRALEAANRLGLVFEHHLDAERFYYVMRYVRGDDLDKEVQRLHAAGGHAGLGDADLASVLTYSKDLLESLDRFHQGGLWHKDVKPANLIVSEGHAHLVDFGLVTPLQSALTLTTHGTEYYRDPEMVRLAMQGVKVHEVDGVKFDLYSAGAVLFSMVENSFPAHGSLSQIVKRCPDAMTWIIRRAMANIDSRYRSAREMLEDVEAVAQASDPFALRPADLPSVQRGDVQDPGGDYPGVEPIAQAFAREPEPPARLDTGSAAAPRRRRFRKVLVAAVVAFIVARGILFDDRRGNSRDYGRRMAVPVEPTRLYGSEKEAYELGQAALDAVSYDDEVSRWSALWDDHLEGQLPTGRSLEIGARVAPAAMRNATQDKGRVLILRESPLGVHGVEEPTLGALRQALVRRGFEITESRDAEAGARHAVGLGTLEDTDAYSRLQDFLDDERSLEAIVWLAGRADAPQYRVLVSRDLELGPPLRLE